MAKAAFTHSPVMLREVMATLQPIAGVYIDATFGRGGYTAAILAHHPEARVLAVDRDASAIAWGQKHFSQAIEEGRLELFHRCFSELCDVAGPLCGLIQGVVFDLGVSSPQLDDAARGFSFQTDGPLDMGMGLNATNAAQFLASASQEEIRGVLRELGEERFAGRIARKIVEARAEKALETTQQLVAIVKAAIPSRGREKIHPATRTFQAVRMHVNAELEELRAALEQSFEVLEAGGRLVTVSFHSLEDRIVKRFLKPRLAHLASRYFPAAEDAGGRQAYFRVPGKQPLMASEEEVRGNPRARSACLRWGEKVEERQV